MRRSKKTENYEAKLDPKVFFYPDEDTPSYPDGGARHPFKVPRGARFMATILILVTAAIIIFLLSNRSGSSNPLPENILKSLTFTAYYPDDPGNQYKLVKGSPKQSNGYLFFDISKNNGTISVTQQPIPDELANFRIDGFSEVATDIGSMLVGTTKDTPSALITTEKTLITLRGSGQISQEDINEVGKKMRPL